MPPIVATLIYLYPQNTQVIEIDGLQDQLTGDFLNIATVQATLVDQRGNPDPVLNDIAMTYVPGSNGNYQGVVPFAFNAPLGSGYRLQIQADQSGVQAFWSIPAQVVLRTQ